MGLKWDWERGRVTRGKGEKKRDDELSGDYLEAKLGVKSGLREKYILPLRLPPMRESASGRLRGAFLAPVAAHCRRAIDESFLFANVVVVLFLS